MTMTADSFRSLFDLKGVKPLTIVMCKVYYDDFFEDEIAAGSGLTGWIAVLTALAQNTKVHEIDDRIFFISIEKEKKIAIRRKRFIYLRIARMEIRKINFAKYFPPYEKKRETELSERMCTDISTPYEAKKYKWNKTVTWNSIHAI